MLRGARPDALGARRTPAGGSAAEDQVFDQTLASNRRGTDPATGLTDTVHPGYHLRHRPGQLVIRGTDIHTVATVPEFSGQSDPHRPPGQFVGHFGSVWSLSESAGRLPNQGLPSFPEDLPVRCPFVKGRPELGEVLQQPIPQLDRYAFQKGVVVTDGRTGIVSPRLSQKLSSHHVRCLIVWGALLY